MQELSVTAAISGRKSVRRFLPRPVEVSVVRGILAAACRAPSGSNTQPWGVDVVSGAPLKRLSARVLAELDAELVRKPNYAYLPDPLPAPYTERLSDFVSKLSALDGIDRRSAEGPRQALAWNYRFFGAPLGLFFHIDRSLEWGSWLDLGMFMQNVMLLARAHDLETCAQVSWTNYGHVVQDELQIPDSRMIVAGMSMGYADAVAAPNRLETPRETPDTFARFHE
jgi:nitroreductase